jgi:hypothetical protein
MGGRAGAEGERVGWEVGRDERGRGGLGRGEEDGNITIFNLHLISCIVRMYVCCSYRTSALHDGYE